MSKSKIKIIKVCPECNDHEYLCWSPFNDGTTDCGACGCNWEEYELEDKKLKNNLTLP